MSITSVVNDTVTSVSVINALKPLPPTITNYSVGGLDDTALDPAGGQTVQINGTGFLPGATITFDGSAVAVVTYVSPNRLTFTSPAKSAGTYTIYVVNSDGGTAIYIPGIIYSVLPTWTTGAGTLGSYYETQSISNTVVASGDAPITYSLFSGSLPTGSTLAANGVITGTAPVDSSSTTYSFTIQATDAQLQDSTRSFSLTINTDVVTWVSPANNTTYTSAVDSAISNVALSATDAAGYAVSYSANALPTGLSLTGANISGTPTVIADSSTLLTATAATTNRTATRTINWSITVANDAYFEYNTLLIPGASTTFVDDASTNNFAVTINGDTKPNNFNPYTPGYYSGYFDGTGDYLSLPSNSAFTLGTSDFTIELWYNSSVSYASGNSYIFDMGTNGTRIQLFQNSVYFIPQTGNSIQTSAGVGMSVGVWTHIAAVRNGSTMTLYINGTSVGSVTNSNNLTDMLFKIGDYGAGGYGFNGYISNVRLVKGNAVYTTNFTPPTTPLTAIANTSLLTCQSNRFIDNSTNNFTLTVNGNTTISSFDPFVPNTSYSTYGSGYFDGTGDYLTVPNNTSLGMGSGNFTIEFWVYQTSLVSFRQILDVVDGNSVGRLILWVDSAGTLYNLGQNGNARNTTAAGAITTNTWIHVALVRSSGTTKFYINGTQSGSNYTDSTTYTCTTGSVYIGINSDGGTYPYQGYLTDFRMVKGTAVYTTAFTPPAAPLTAIANTQLLTLQNNQSVNNNVFLDNSTNNFFVTRNGNTTQGTFSPYGGNWSNYFTGSSYLNLPSSSALSLGTGDFCIEGWLNVSSTSGINTFIQSPWAVGGSSFAVWQNHPSWPNKIVVFAWSYSNSNPLMVSTSQFVIGQWYHLAVTRSGTAWKLFINGVSEATASGSYNIGYQLSYIGCYDTTNFFFQGYISNTRVVKGSAVYTSNFTPSTTPLTPITNTSLLTCQSNRFIDNSNNALALTISGTPTIQRYSPFNPSSLTPTSYSGYFDGTGDYLTLASNSAFQITGDFTIEAWVYATSINTYQNIMSQYQNSTNSFACGYNSTQGWYFNYSNNASEVTNYRAGTSPLNAWTHVAYVKSSTTMTVYVNGTALASTITVPNLPSLSATLNIGIWGGASSDLWNGYISNLRMVKGVAVYTGAFTVPTSPLTSTQSSGTNIAAITGTSTSLLTCQSTTFIDNSTNNFTITAFGNSQPTIQNPFGYTSATTNGYTVSTIGGSGYFDGSGDSVSVGAAANCGSGGAFAMGANFTVEFWYYPLSTSEQALVENFTGTAGPGWTIYRKSGGQIEIYNGTSAFGGSIVLTTGQWYHIAFVRTSSTSAKTYINGVADMSTTSFGSNEYFQSTYPLYVGQRNPGDGRNFYTTGYFSDVRITKSAVYSANFTPPTAPQSPVANTSAMLNYTSAGIYDAAMMNNMETVGDAKLSTAVSKFGGSSMSFDGTGDYLIAPQYQNFDFGTGDFTVEAWIYMNSLPVNDYKQIVCFGTGPSSQRWILFIDTRTSQSNPYLRFLSLNSGGTVVIDVPGAGSSGWSANTWYYVAVTRSGNTFKLFRDGVQNGATVTNAGSCPATASTGALYVGAEVGGGFANWNGYIDDLRITKGYARYTSNFTPPTIAFPVY